MKKSILFAVSMAFCFFCPSLSLEGYAQGKASEVLRSLTFELPNKFYAVKGSSANYRNAPNTKAKKFELFDWVQTATPGMLLGDMGNNATWLSFKNKGKNVYVSKSVLREVTPSGTIFPSCYNKIYGWMGPEMDYETFDGYMWRVGVQKGGAGLAICELNYYGYTHLLLGKKIGDIFVFKYAVGMYHNDYFNWELDNKPYIIENSDVYDEVKEGYKQLWVDEKKFGVHITSNGRDTIQPDLTKLTDSIIYQLFHEVIEKDIQTHFFLDADKFSSKYYDNTFG